MRGSVGTTQPVLRSRTFQRIYLTNRWKGNQTETRSGPGSTWVSTRRLREALPGLVAELGAGSVLDLGCGASWWMPDLPGYRGLDIVPQAVRAVQEHFPDRTYGVGDLVVDPLPQADLVIVRDVLAHLPTPDVLAALANIRASGAHWLMATTFNGADNAVETHVGGYHEIDLSTSPFDLGTPLRTIPDGYWEEELVYPTKMMGLWQRVW